MFWRPPTLHRSGQRTTCRSGAPGSCINHVQMSSITSALRPLYLVVLSASFVACASRSYDSLNTLGVMPLRAPTPVWLGAIRGSGPDTIANPIAGAAAVTPSQTPGWAHVLISLDDISSGGEYAWSLHSGSCGAQGSVIGPADHYSDFAIHADGSGAAEAIVPLELSPSASYAVIATRVSPGGSGATACADLIRTSL